MGSVRWRKCGMRFRKHVSIALRQLTVFSSGTTLRERLVQGNIDIDNCGILWVHGQDMAQHKYRMHLTCGAIGTATLG